LPRQLLTALHDACEPAIRHADAHTPAALAPELEAERRARDIDVTATQGRETERSVRFRILLVAYTDERRLEQSRDRRQHLLAWQAGAGEIAVDAVADRG